MTNTANLAYCAYLVSKCDWVYKIIAKRYIRAHQV